LHLATVKIWTNSNIYFTNNLNAGSSEVVTRCLAAGLFPNAAYLHHSGVYKTVRGDIELVIHPSSVLYAEEYAEWYRRKS
jgi:hypothetical protein